VDRASLEALIAEGLSLEEIGRRLGRHHSTIANWLRAEGLQTLNAERFAPRGGLDHETLRPFAEAGASLTAIAAELDRDPTTVRYWLRKLGLETLRRSRRPRKRVDLEITRPEERMCGEHGLTPHALRDGYFRCLRCLKEAVVDRRRRFKQILVREAGGECVLCGYDECVAALHFHHVDPASKRFALSGQGMTRGLQALQEEARKCVLLCANCHAEVESGVVTLGWSLGKVPA